MTFCAHRRRPLRASPRIAAQALVVTWTALLLAAALPCAAAIDSAETLSAPAAQSDAGAEFAVHGQITYVEQESNRFNAPYAGPNSLSPDIGRETVDATLQIGARLWRGAEIWLNPEVDQGFGLDNTLGVAAFTSGAAYKVGRNQPYFRFNRAFIRDTINLGDATQEVEATANQMSGLRSADRWVFTFGKFSIPDVFDTNQYAHDPRADFLNWAAIDAATFDYAADSWGYTLGAAAEWYQGDWALRAGLFDLSNVPNSEHLDSGAHEFQMIGEVERRYGVAGHPGRALLTLYQSRARMGLLNDAVALAAATGEPVNIALVRQYRSRSGLSIGIEQELTEDLGAFARIGGAGGNVEVYEFTDVDRAHEVGLSLKGRRWDRPQDTVAIAVLDDRISAKRERYLDAGGLGILVGDGRLPRPGPEEVLETYYNIDLRSWLQLTLDYQWVDHPAYNRDRGPASILAVRVHAQF